MIRTTISLLLLCAASAGVTAAQEPQELPDSTYLKLALELPIMGTYSYDVVSGNAVRNVHGTIRNVDVVRCTLSFEILLQTPAHRVTTHAIPLKAIDPKSLSIQVAHPPRYARYEPQPWLLQVGMRPDSDARIVSGTREAPGQRTTRRIDLTFKDYETAAAVKGWLLDGADRCDTWKTTPLKPIR